jgi:glycosyltransferase involved in cell wall biosynthesis
MGKKKILHVIHAAKIGGAESAVFSSLKSMNNWFDYKVIVIDSCTKENFNFLDKDIIDYIHFFDGKHPFDIPSYYRILNFILTEKPNLLIASLWRSVFVGILYKIIFFICGFSSNMVIFKHSSRYKHIFDKLSHSFGYLFSDFVFCDSKASLDSIFFKFVKKKSKIISFIFRNKKVEGVSAYKSIGDSPNIRFLFIGRLHPVKRIDLAIEVLTSLNKLSSRNIELDVYGPDEQNTWKRLQMVAEKLKFTKLRYKGVLTPDELRKKVTNYHFYIQLSKYEGMGLSVIEAMMNGLVCVVNPVGEIANYTEEFVTAIYYDENSPNPIENVTRKILDVIDTDTDYQLISINSAKKFDNLQTYEESLKACLDEILP